MKQKHEAKLTTTAAATTNKKQTATKQQQNSNKPATNQQQNSNKTATEQQQNSNKTATKQQRNSNKITTGKWLCVRLKRENNYYLSPNKQQKQQPSWQPAKRTKRTPVQLYRRYQSTWLRPIGPFVTRRKIPSRPGVKMCELNVRQPIRGQRLRRLLRGHRAAH